MKDLAFHPSEIDEAQAAVASRGDGTLRSWRRILEQFDSEYDWKSPEFINAVGTLWLEDEEERIKLLQELVPEGKFSVIANGNVMGVKTMIQEFYSEIENDSDSNEIVSSLVAAYSDYINNDLDTFVSALKAQAYLNKGTEQEVGERKLRKVATQLGSHAFDVIKIAAGVSIGIVAGSLFKRK